MKSTTFGQQGLNKNMNTTVAGPTHFAIITTNRRIHNLPPLVMHRLNVAHTSETVRKLFCKNYPNETVEEVYPVVFEPKTGTWKRETK